MNNTMRALSLRGMGRSAYASALACVVIIGVAGVAAFAAIGGIVAAPIALLAGGVYALASWMRLIDVKRNPAVLVWTVAPTILGALWCIAVAPRVITGDRITGIEAGVYLLWGIIGTAWLASRPSHSARTGSLGLPERTNQSMLTGTLADANTPRQHIAFGSSHGG